jgi:hypothetical protein|tara:strand:+ start:550 stop:1128 length:579 start_codon:yes stop_codon:yes gene_type:complete
MPANTPIKVCSRASVLMGGSPISSFDEGTAEAEVVDAMYEDIARAALTSTRWRFATNQQVLNRLAAAPTSRYDAAYQMPSDLLMLSTVTVNDDPIIYDTYGDKVYCDMSTNEVVIADYIYRASESSWPSYFTLAVEFQVAAMLSISIARDPSLAQMMDQQGERQMIKARRLDSQQQTTRKLMTSRFIAQRRS